LKESLFSQGFVSFVLPKEFVDSRMSHVGNMSNNFFTDRTDGSLTVVLNDKTPTWKEVDLELQSKKVYKLCTEVGIPLKSILAPPDDSDISTTFEIHGKYSTLKRLSELINEGDIPIFQMWYYIDAYLFDSKDDTKCITRALLDIYEQFYGYMTEGDRYKTLRKTVSRAQLYDYNHHINVHQDGDEYLSEATPSGMIKNCFMLFYFSDNWKEGYGGELEISPGWEHGGSEYNNSMWPKITTIKVAPDYGRVAILDFTKFNNPHMVHKILNKDFIRKGTSYIWERPKNTQTIT
jgi:hypothetical protein